MFARYLIVGILFLWVSACSFLSPELTPTPVPPTSSLPRYPSLTAPQPASNQVESTLTAPDPTSLPLRTQLDETKSSELITPTFGISSTASFPDPQNYIWERVVEGLQKPNGLVHAGDGSGRIFIIEQVGKIRFIQEGELFPESYLDIRERVGRKSGEQGLLGIAFHPRYAENGYFYVNYTDINGETIISRFVVSSDNPHRADPESEKRLLVISQPYQNHNGGSVVFGPDGFLYLGLGDGGAGGDPHENGQSTNTLLGKILRIDVDEGEIYAIPQSNPFVNGGGLPEIWAYGLRNPWRFTFDRLTGDLFIGDVGQNQWEEIDYYPYGGQPGANFGWNYREGAHPFKGVPPDGLNLIDPVAEYDHSQGCSVTGGVIYRGIKLPAWQGVYLYGDYCSGNVWGLLQNTDGDWQVALMFETGIKISSFGEDEMGEIYLVDHMGGVFRLSE